jgi:hypothetical protein
MSRSLVLAVDLGQSHDYTAVVVIDSTGSGADRKHDIVHIERYRETPYPEQVRRIAGLYQSLRERARRLEYQEHEPTSVELVVDATGVGAPVLDMFREADLRPRGVIITGGEVASQADGVDRVPKRVLVTCLQVALQAKRLRIAEDLPLAEVLMKELRAFKVHIGLTGHARFGNDVGSWREADHDDLVLAASLGVWLLEHGRSPQPRIRVL